MSAQRYGSDVIVDLLQAFGIEHVALNPGSSFRGLHDSLVNHGRGRPEIVLCTHEKVAVNLAHGYAKVTGRPMAAIVHDVVGLMHAALGIYCAHVDRSPVLVLGATGPLDRTRRRPYIDWIHTANVQGNAVRDYTKWDDQPATVADFPASFARAYRFATTEPAGPVYLCYDAGLQEQRLERPVPVDGIAAAARPTRIQGDPHALDRAAELLAGAERPLIVSEFTGRHPEAVADLVGLAEEIGAGVVDLNGRVNFPNRHPLNVSGGDALRQADVILALDVGDLFRALHELDRETNRTRPRTREGAILVDLGLSELRQSKWTEDLGQFQPVALSILADTRLALPELRRLVGGRESRDRSAWRHAVEAMHAALERRWHEEAQRDRDASPLSAARLASEIWDAVKAVDWVLTGNTLEGWALRLWNVDGPARHAGRSLGTATQIGTALGVGLAHRGTDKLVVDIQPDGDLLYDPGALWTAAHHRIPLLVVMYDNRAYYSDWEQQLRVAEHRGTSRENTHVGMTIDDPAPDFATLARAFGWYAEGPIVDPEAAGPAIRRAVQHVRRTATPALVDTVVRRRQLVRYS